MSEFEQQIHRTVDMLSLTYVGRRQINRYWLDRTVSEDTIWETLDDVFSLQALTLISNQTTDTRVTYNPDTGTGYEGRRHNFGQVKGAGDPLTVYMPSRSTVDFAWRLKGEEFFFFVPERDQARGERFVEGFIDLVSFFEHPTVFTLAETGEGNLVAHTYDTQATYRREHFATLDALAATPLTASDDEHDIVATYQEQSVRRILGDRKAQSSLQGLLYRHIPDTLGAYLIRQEQGNGEPTFIHINE